MKRLVLAVLVVLSLALGVSPQTFRGSINGTVTDPSGGSVPNATVKATEIATGIDHTTTTTNDGLFAFQDIPLGFYRSEEHTSELQSQSNLVCRLLLDKKNRYTH